MADLSKKEEALLQKLIAKKLEKDKNEVKLNVAEKHRIEKLLAYEGRAVVTVSAKGQVSCFSWEGYKTRVETGLRLKSAFPKAALKRLPGDAENTPVQEAQ